MGLGVRHTVPFRNSVYGEDSWQSEETVWAAICSIARLGLHSAGPILCIPDTFWVALYIAFICSV